jgi:hypothetical protein
VDNEVLTRLKHVAEMPFKRISYTDVIDVLISATQGGTVFEDMDITWGMDLGSEHERCAPPPSHPCHMHVMSPQLSLVCQDCCMGTEAEHWYPEIMNLPCTRSPPRPWLSFSRQRCLVIRWLWYAYPWSASKDAHLSSVHMVMGLVFSPHSVLGTRTCRATKLPIAGTSANRCSSSQPLSSTIRRRSRRST